MKKILSILMLAVICVQCFSQQYHIAPVTKRILFLGNSITYSGQYIAYIETYIKLKTKTDQIEFMNLGLPSETVSGLSEPNHADGKFPRPDLHERLQRVLSSTKPDLVFACYGMNDGIYLPFESARFKKYQDGIHWLHDTITELHIPIVFFTPPVYDERKGKDYALVLDKYADWLLSTRNTAHWNVIDIHFQMKAYLEAQRNLDSSFSFAADGVHPNETGHWIMARAVLSGLGFTEVNKANNMQQAINQFANGKQVLRLVEERQSFMKDAWLTLTKHTRPMMPTGLPMETAASQAQNIKQQLYPLLK